MTSMANRHRLGWTSQANLDLTMLSVRLPQEVVEEFSDAAAAAGMTKRAAMKEAIREFVSKHGRPKSRAQTSQQQHSPDLSQNEEFLHARRIQRGHQPL